MLKKINLKKVLPYEFKFKKEFEVPRNIELGLISSNYLMEKEPFLKTVVDLIVKRFNLNKNSFLVMPLYEQETYSFKNWQVMCNNVPIIKAANLEEILKELKKYALSLPSEESFREFKIMIGAE